MRISTVLRRILLLVAPVAGSAAIALIMLLGNLFERIAPEIALPYPLGLVVVFFLLAIAGAVTAYVTLLLEPIHKIKAALIMAVLWTGLLFYLLLMNGLVPGNQGNTTAELIAFKSLLLSLVACAGGLLVVYFFHRRLQRKAQKQVAV